MNKKGNNMKIRLKTLMNGLLLAGGLTAAMQGFAGTTTRVSVASDGSQGDGASFGGISISADGRFVAFISDASNLVANDTNGLDDIFVHDHQTGETTMISVASDGTQGNGDSSISSISADGRFVAFESLFVSPVTRLPASTFDVFVHDRQTGETTRVSMASDGTQRRWPFCCFLVQIQQFGSWRYK
jgi:Tol biopolymer transport system component